jgi:hypothetical protein
MHRYFAEKMVSIALLLGDLRRFIDTPPAQWNALAAMSSQPRVDPYESIKSYLIGLKRGCEEADLPISAATISKHIEYPPSTSGEVKIIFDFVVTEMQQRAYFRMPPDRVPYWNKKDLLTEPASKAFGEQVTMLETASTCYAFGLPVACVFHAMQAVETGLRVVADSLGANMTGQENMRTVIEAIETKSREIEELPNKKHPTKNADAQFYGEIATNASNFKNAWRNYVAHGKAPYTDQHAFDVLHDVRRFFNKLAERFSSEDVDKANANALASAAQPS